MKYFKSIHLTLCSISTHSGATSTKVSLFIERPYFLHISRYTIFLFAVKRIGRNWKFVNLYYHTLIVNFLITVCVFYGQMLCRFNRTEWTVNYIGSQKICVYWIRVISNI